MLNKFLQKYKKWNPTKGVRLLLLFIPIILLFITFRIDNDFWFLINTGKTILEKGFITTEIFTIHEGLSFIPQQWLTDIIFYLLYSKFGIYGIFFFLQLINIIIIYIMYKLCLLVTNNKIKLSLLITIITDFILEISVFTTRPQIFDILFLLLEIYLLELYIKNKNKKYLIGLPIISIMMINLHASIWPMCLVFLVPYLLGNLKIKWVKREDYKIIPLIITFIIMILVSLINPYKIEAIKYFFNSYGISSINSSIGEMMPLTITKGLMVFVYIFLILLSYYFNRKGKINLRYLLLILGTTYLLLEHYKGMIFFSVASVVSLSYNLKDYFKEESKECNKIKYLNLIVVLLIIFLFTIFTINVKIVNESDITLSKIADYLDEHANKDIKLYTNYNNGGYFEYRGYKVYIDPRAEVFLKSNNKKEDILDEYFDLGSGRLDYEDFLNKYNFDYLVVDSQELLYIKLEKLGYTKLYEAYDNKYKINYKVYKGK